MGELREDDAFNRRPEDGGRVCYLAQGPYIRLISQPRPLRTEPLLSPPLLRSVCRG